MSDFINNPSKEELMESLDVALAVENYKANGFSVFLSNGSAYYKNEYGENVEIGKLPNLADTTTYLFGNTVPDSVEYVTIDGITLMTYQGALIACGYLEKSEEKEYVYAINDYVNGDVISAAGEVYDFFADKSFYGMASKLVTIITGILGKHSSETDYDGQAQWYIFLADTMGVTGGADSVLQAYYGVGSTAVAKDLFQVLLLELETSNYTIVESATIANYNVEFEWAEDSETSGVSLVDVDVIFKKHRENLKNEYEHLRKKVEQYVNESTVNCVEQICEEYEKASTVRIPTDPLIMDIDNDGINISSLAEGSYFDMDGDGVAEKVNWTTKDAFLVHDVNNDGVVNNASELFGDQTYISTGEQAKNGFEALAQYDDNQDGVINADDSVFSDLSIWQDIDGNGISEKSELKTVSEAGIKEINLSYNSDAEYEHDEVTTGGMSTFLYEDGTESQIGQFWLSQNAYDTVDRTNIEISEELQDYPEIRSIGKMNALQVALAQDTTGYLKSLVDSFSSSYDIEQKKEIVEQMLHFMCNTENIESDSRGSGIDAKNLTVIETMLGESFRGSNGTNPNYNAIPILNKVYVQLVESYYAQLVSQTSLKDLLLLVLVEEDESGAVTVDTRLFNQLVSGYLDTEEGKGALQDMAMYLKYMCTGDVTGYDSFRLFFASDNAMASQLIAQATKDIVLVTGETNGVGTAEMEFMVGDENDNSISGSGGDDILSGGIGNDTLSGGIGADTYYIGVNSGNDIINNQDVTKTRTSDRIVFGEGILAEDILVQRNGDDMQLVNKKTGQVTTVYSQNYRQNIYYVIEQVEFADGTKWTLEDLIEKQKDVRGTETDDIITGQIGAYSYSIDETMHGYAGNDTLKGEYGNDTLYGGAGNDTLYGGAGTDTYYIGVEDGDDTINNFDNTNDRLSDRIIFGEGIAAEDIIVKGNDVDMQLVNRKTGQITTVHAQYHDKYYTIEQVEFADGTKWTLEDLIEKQKDIRGTEADDTITGHASAYGYDADETIHGYAGDDTIKGEKGNDTLYGDSGSDILNGGYGEDTLYGGTGNDTLYGGSGADAYYIGVEDGDDTIHNDDTTNDRTSDRIVFGEGILAEDIFVKRVGEDMQLVNQKTGQITTVYKQNNSQNKYYVIEQVEFADGTKWSLADLIEKQKDVRGTEADDTITGQAGTYSYSVDETIHGYGGNDTLNGDKGNDTLYGGTGDDILSGGTEADALYGDEGDDRFNGGRGADTYYIEADGGNDTIDNHDLSNDRAMDRIVFGEGIKAEDILVKRNGYDMQLINQETGQVTTVYNQYYKNYYALEKIEFADGTEWNLEDLIAKAEMHGTEADDKLEGYKAAYGYSTTEVMYGYDGNDIIIGNEGNDTIYGGTGDDTMAGGAEADVLYGETGNDTMTGGEGTDTYHIEVDGGDDTINNYDRTSTRVTDRIIFGEGIVAEDIIVRRNGYDMQLINQKTGQITTVFYQYYNSYYALEKIEFADGTEWTLEDLIARMEIHGSEENDTLQGSKAVYGYSASEVLYGHGGNDTIGGYEGNDTIYGGTGDDTLGGGIGADTYYIDADDGNDTINNSDSTSDRTLDKIVFGEGIKAEDIMVRRNGYDMQLINQRTGQVTTVYNQYYNKNNVLEKIEFADGTEWTLEDLIERVDIHGTEANDTINGQAAVYGYSADETIYGYAGHDTLNGYAGNDTLYGGVGNDTLNGGADADILYGDNGDDTLTGGGGADTYHIGAEDGNDTINNYDTTTETRTADKIVFGEGIEAGDILVKRNGYDMQLVNRKTGQVTTVQKQFYQSYYTLETVEFADGTKWSLADLVEKQKDIEGTEVNDTINGQAAVYGYSADETMHGYGGNDTLNGGAGNDTLYGGIGNDTLNGGNGNDTYVIGKGDGSDVILDYDSTTGNSDTLVIEEEAKRLLFAKNGSDLLISIMDTQDTITVQNWYKNDYYKVENIRTGDGCSLAHSQVDLLIQAMAEFESTSGMSWAEGVASNHEEIDTVTSQIWIKQEV